MVHEHIVGGSNMIRFRLVIAISERDMLEIKPGWLGWQTSAIINELQELIYLKIQYASLLPYILYSVSKCSFFIDYHPTQVF